MAPATFPRRQRQRQRGLYALEFGIVFLLFFALLYALIALGILFTLRFGLQNAAEEGARSALRYQVAAGGDQLPARVAMARQVATQRVTGWLPVAATVQSSVCEVRTGTCVAPVCNATWEQRCQIRVVVTAAGIGTLMPVLRFALPATLVGQASMLLDGQALP